jgi:hypothetical protein
MKTKYEPYYIGVSPKPWAIKIVESIAPGIESRTYEPRVSYATKSHCQDVCDSLNEQEVSKEKATML